MEVVQEGCGVGVLLVVEVEVEVSQQGVVGGRDGLRAMLSVMELVNDPLGPGGR